MQRLRHDGPIVLPANAARGLERLAASIGIGRFDLLLLGDGSGTVYGEPAGWSCAAYDCRTQEVVLHAGGLTCGTNNFAELFPYVQALWFHDQQHQADFGRSDEVHIVSDSQLTVRCGNRRYSRMANQCLWAAIESFEAKGYRLVWHHIRRSSHRLNELADEVAGRMRRSITKQMEILHESLGSPNSPGATPPGSSFPSAAKGSS